MGTLKGQMFQWKSGEIPVGCPCVFIYMCKFSPLLKKQREALAFLSLLSKVFGYHNPQKGKGVSSSKCLSCHLLQKNAQLKIPCRNQHNPHSLSEA